jgi:hypothetical protein
MPSFVNIGAYVDEGTMVDTWATVGSCAQIGKNVHISGGAGIGGVLEPLQAGPVIIEDNCFIGARSEVAEGVIVERRRGAVDGRVPRRLDQDRRPRHRRGLHGRVPAIRWSSPARCPARTAAPPRLRGDRQAGRRAHPLQDQHQRAAEGRTRRDPEHRHAWAAACDGLDPRRDSVPADDASQLMRAYALVNELGAAARAGRTHVPLDCSRMRWNGSQPDGEAACLRELRGLGDHSLGWVSECRGTPDSANCIRVLDGEIFIHFSLNQGQQAIAIRIEGVEDNREVE